MNTVALRKESVDRNLRALAMGSKFDLSLSARRAWIEICIMRARKAADYGRSPQGERG